MMLEKRYQDYLPKVDPNLIYDLLVRQREDPLITPMYMLEVFTKGGIDSQIREHILKKTGMVPAIYDNGIHYVTNQKITIDMLKTYLTLTMFWELVVNILVVMEVWVLHMNKETTGIAMITISRPQVMRNSLTKKFR